MIDTECERGDPMPDVEESSADILTARDSHGEAVRVSQVADTLSLAIAYTHMPWIDARRVSMARLMSQIEKERRETRGGGFSRWDEKCFNERMPNHVWSDLMWRWAHEQRTTHALFLQDDVVLAPRFFEILHAMLTGARDRKVIALHVPSPRARDVFRENVRRWVTTDDGLIGIGYVIAHEALEDFLAWKDTKLAPRAAERTTEDSLIDAWALDAEIPISHPIPTIVDHDIAIASSYGNDRHTERRPLVTWRDLDVLDTPSDLLDPATWNTPAVHLGRHFPKSHWVARMVLADEKRGADLAAAHEREPFTMSPWIYP